MQSVLTHELGHVYALDDLGASGTINESQTMTYRNFLCDKRARTLGRADLNAIRAKYPAS